MGIFQWTSALEIASVEPPEPDYLVDELIVRGSITQLTAKIKIGKTTLLHTLIKGMMWGESVLGLKTKKAKVLYCTEEGPITFTRALRRNNLDGELNLGILHLQNVPSTFTWENIANGILELVMEEQIDVVIFDTLTRWARMKEDKENDAGAAGQIMKYLEILRKSGVAVVLVFHEKKGGGDIADAARGSSAFGGAADTLVQIQDAGQNQHPNRRILKTTGRLYEARKMIIEYNDGIYEALTSVHDEYDTDEESLAVEGAIFENRIPNILTDFPGCTINKLAELLQCEPKNTTLRRSIKNLIINGVIGRSGRGTNGNPYVYTLEGATEGAS